MVCDIATGSWSEFIAVVTVESQDQTVCCGYFHCNIYEKCFTDSDSVCV